MNPVSAAKSVSVEALLPQVSEFRKGGYRLAQISATRLVDEVELTYSFDKNLRLENLRVHLPAEALRVPSITSVYWCAFLYENELHDLFNVQVDGLAVDFHGGFYKTAIPFPFGSTKPPVAPQPALNSPRAAQATAPAPSATLAGPQTSAHPN